MYGWEENQTRRHLFKSTSELAGNRKVYENILECIGNTPLVKLNKIPKEHGLKCDIYAKCEFLNPAGSIKDRIGLAMLKDAESHGVLRDDTIFVEPTSGNTGIAIAYVASLRGNDSIIVTSVKNSDDKVNTMRLLGSEVIQIKTTDSATAIARKIKDADPERVIMLDQFENDVNPRAHYENTGVEILDALGNVDMVVMGAGTGGTMSGVGHRLKEHNPQCLLIAAEPLGSTVFNKEGKSHPFLVEGIGGSSAPIVVDTTIADGFEVVTDEEAFLMARDLSKKEGMLCGGSSGVALVAAIKAAKRYDLKASQRIVVFLPDGIRNYMSKFVSDQWMEAYRFLEPPQHTMSWWKTPITDLKTHKYPVINIGYTCAQALRSMNKRSHSLALVEDGKGHFVGVASKEGFRNYATNPTKLPGRSSEEFDFESPVTDYMVKHVFTLALNSKKGTPTIGLVSRVLDITPFVVIGQEAEDHFTAMGIVTSDDLLDYIYHHSPTKQNL